MVFCKVETIFYVEHGRCKCSWTRYLIIAIINSSEIKAVR